MRLWPFTKVKGSGDESNPEQDKALLAILYLMLLGFGAIVFISFWAGLENKVFWSVTGLSVTVGLASTMSGGFLGFLFGIPRSLQRGTSEPAAAGTGATIKERAYSNNTNLEQISDWLTKIIVGVSLTQLPNIEQGFYQLSMMVARGFGPNLRTSFTQPYSGALILFYSICGFIAVYLWAKIYLLRQLILLDGYLDEKINQKLDKVETKVNDQRTTIELTKFESQFEEFARVKNKLKLVESKSEFKSIVETAKPDPVKYIDDCQKGRWGGSSISGGYRLDATFLKTDPLDDSYEVTLTVKPENKGTPLVGSVYFFLHDTYYPECVQMTVAQNNVASIVISSFEAFTVGAVCNNGLIKLELDLNLYASAPEDYKYKEPLMTFEELKNKITELHQEKSDES